MKIPLGDRTPMLEQYTAIKRRHPDAVLFYRMGDFFEMFYDDAKLASEVLGLRLTSRAHGKGGAVPLAGFPHHQLDNYLTRMVEAGHRVVIVEQVEDPKAAKGLVKRDVVRIVTAGTNPATVDRDDLTPRRVAALVKRDDHIGLAWADLANGDFAAGQFTQEELRQVLPGIAPVEVVLPESSADGVSIAHQLPSAPVVSTLVDWVWEPAFARKTLLDHFGTVGLKGYGIEDLNLAVCSAGALLHYLKGNLRVDPAHITSLTRAEVGGKLFLQPSTRRNLELAESLSQNPRATLFAVIDRTVTVPGRRLLLNRLLEPLADRRLIEERLDAVQELVESGDRRTSLRRLLRGCGDIQRCVARLATGRGSARDLAALRESLAILPEVAARMAEVRSRTLQALSGRINPMPELKALLEAALVDDPPVSTSEGGMFRSGYSLELDDLRKIRESGKTYLEDLERRLRAVTGIANLKVGYNRVFGYFLEVTKANLDKVPPEWQRRQTLVNAERFTTPELLEYEQKLVTAEEDINRLEADLFKGLVEVVLRRSPELQDTARALAELDVHAALAELAVQENYCRPELDDSDTLILHDCRHPVVEHLLPPGEQFVPNDLEIGGERRILIITGPNMAGKSTYIRQVALAVILAQMGSFVPARQARIGIVDKLFTRIGAMDNLAGGESTFLIEMQETAAILHNATPKSLVLFDEVGRGTSTFDGLSLAWSIVEYLHQSPRLHPRTLFATHFHELVDLEKHLPGVKNYNVAVREYGERVVFLRKIVPGGCDRSFGIYVAQMAGLPPEIISRAREVLAALEANDLSPAGPLPDDKGKPARSAGSASRPAPQRHLAQLTFFDLGERKLVDRLAAIDLNALTPIEALKVLAELKAEIERGG